MEDFRITPTNNDTFYGYKNFVFRDRSFGDELVVEARSANDETVYGRFSREDARKVAHGILEGLGEPVQTPVPEGVNVEGYTGYESLEVRPSNAAPRDVVIEARKGAVSGTDAKLYLEPSSAKSLVEAITRICPEAAPDQTPQKSEAQIKSEFLAGLLNDLYLREGEFCASLAKDAARRLGVEVHADIRITYRPMNEETI